MAIKPGGGLVPIDNASFVWQTHDGKAPRSELVIFHAYPNKDRKSVAIVETISVILLLITAATGFSLYAQRKKPEFIDTFSKINAIVIFGSALPILLLCFYRSEDIYSQTFCILTPVAITIGLTLVEGGLASQFIVAVIWQQRGNLGRLRKIKKQTMTMLAILMVIVVILMIILYAGGNIPSKKEFQNIDNIDNSLLLESFTVVHWFSCTTPNIYWVTIVIIQIYAFAGICSAETIKRDINATLFFTSGDRDFNRGCLYFIFPISLAGIFTIQSFNDEWIQFLGFAGFSFVQNIACVSSFWLWKIFFNNQSYIVSNELYRPATTVFAITRLYGPVNWNRRRSSSQAANIRLSHQRRTTMTKRKSLQTSRG